MSFQALIALDDRLAAHGVPPLGAWWRELLARWYRGDALTLAVCAGRGSAKSTALYKLALTETLAGDWEIPPGERHWASIASVSKEEAAKGTGIIGQWLQQLRVPHDQRDGVIELRGMPRGIRVTAASVAGTSGWRTFFDGSDEVAKWPSEGAVSVDAAEVLASKRAMTITHPRARRVVMSTPFVDSGPFFDIISAGSTNDTLVAVAPTWVATDGRISEEATRKLEPNERVWRREYAAQFGAEWEHGYFSDLWRQCIGRWTSLPWRYSRAYVLALDPAFSADLFAMCVAHAEADVIVVDRVEAIAPPRSGELSPTDCLRRVREIAREYHVRQQGILTDQFSHAALADLAAREGLTLTPIAWSAASKGARFESVRSLMRDRRIMLPDDHALHHELSGISTRLTSGGHEQIRARHGFTDDRVSALVLAASTLASDWSRPGHRMLEALRRFDPEATKIGIDPSLTRPPPGGETKEAREQRIARLRDAMTRRAEEQREWRRALTSPIRDTAEFRQLRALVDRTRR